MFAIITRDDHAHQLWMPDQAQGQVGAMSLIGLPYSTIPIRSERDTKGKAMRRERNETERLLPKFPSNLNEYP